ncbi:MAG TPA: dehydrogenase, partial [Fibrobacteria bacterium]|nr:dehydrogenase [Fibrobacteria bacterium]
MANNNRLRGVRALAPLRLGLAGGGTDVSPYSDQYGGCILNATIDLFAYANIEPRDDGKVVLEALDLKERFEGEAAAPFPRDARLALHRGVYDRVMRDFNGGERIPLTLTTHGDAPVGSGLGSSSAMVVAMLTAFVDLLGLPLGEYDVAHLAYEIERVDLAMQGGKQDQYAATFGGFNYMEFHADRVIVNPLRVRSEAMREIEYNMTLYYLGSSRVSSEIIASQIRNVRTGKSRSIEAMHRLKEQAVLQKEALLKGDLRRFGQLLSYGWEHKKEMSEKISNDTIERVHARCIEAGALGVKVSGAGGGGFMMIYSDGY